VLAGRDTGEHEVSELVAGGPAAEVGQRDPGFGERLAVGIRDLAADAMQLGDLAGRAGGVADLHGQAAHLGTALLRRARLTGERDDIVQRRFVLTADGVPEVGLALSLRLPDLAEDRIALRAVRQTAGERVGGQARIGVEDRHDLRQEPMLVLDRLRPRRHRVRALEHQRRPRLERAAVLALFLDHAMAVLGGLAQVVEEDVDRRRGKLA
jgi:hypothetical protein